jgi:Tol biopolymer transport system component
MSATGFEVKVLVPDAIVIPPIVWSTNGRYIAFRGIQNGASDYYVVDVSDGSQTRLGVGEGYFALGNLSWSPSSDALALDVGLDRSGAMRGVLRVSLHQPEVHRLLPQLAGAYIDSKPQWHPTEDLIVLVSFDISEPRQEQIYVVRSNGTDRQQLTDTDTEKTLAAWSPNGRWIAYGAFTYAIDSGGQYVVLDQQINVLERDGGNERVVIKGVEVGSSLFSWSPDSRHVSFLSSEADHPDRYDLYVADICYHGTVLIAEDVASFTPAWEPLPAAPLDSSDE